MAQRACTVFISCSSFASGLEFYTDELGFRLDMIMPADAPRVAIVSGYGIFVRLESAHRNAARTPLENETFVICRNSSAEAWSLGRAGMLYRDLIPERLSGRFIASHIRIADGGPVPDYVHYHRVRFQMIYCRCGWVRVVYEDQGPEFVMHAGDCVLQPPEIRHRVLESSTGLEVVEIGTPAEHETWRDHGLALPNAVLRPERDFGGQRFVRHVAADARWQRSDEGFEFRDCGIGEATGGLASVRVLRAIAPALRWRPAGEFLFFYVLKGEMRLNSDAYGSHRLASDDSCVVPTGIALQVDADADCEMLEVRLPGR